MGRGSTDVLPDRSIASNAFLLPQGVITHWLADTHGHGSVPHAGQFPQKKAEMKEPRSSINMPSRANAGLVHKPETLDSRPLHQTQSRQESTKTTVVSRSPLSFSWPWPPPNGERRQRPPQGGYFMKEAGFRDYGIRVQECKTDSEADGNTESL